MGVHEASNFSVTNTVLIKVSILLTIEPVTSWKYIVARFSCAFGEPSLSRHHDGTTIYRLSILARQSRARFHRAGRNFRALHERASRRLVACCPPSIKDLSLLFGFSNVPLLLSFFFIVARIPLRKETRRNNTTASRPLIRTNSWALPRLAIADPPKFSSFPSRNFLVHRAVFLFLAFYTDYERGIPKK